MCQEFFSVREIFQETYQLFGNCGEEVVLPPRTEALVMRDNGGEVEKKGFSYYKKAIFFKKGGKHFAISLGTRCGDFPADGHDCDLVIVTIGSGEKKHQINEYSSVLCVQKKLRNNVFFKDSLFVGSRDGTIGTKKEFFSKSIKPIVKKFGNNPEWRFYGEYPLWKYREPMAIALFENIERYITTF